MTQITQSDVEKIAKLVKLDVSGDVDKLSEMFSATLEYINILNELDTSKVEETYQVTGLTNVFQNDKTKSNTITQNEALQNTKTDKSGLFETKGVFDR